MTARIARHPRRSNAIASWMSELLQLRPLTRCLHSVGRPGIPFLAEPFDVWSCREFLSSLLEHEEGAPS
jgi:hypothetical protein